MKKIITIVATLVTGIIVSAGIMSDNGKAGKTNSPGETTCTTSGCHDNFALNSGTGSIVITSSNMTNWTYSPGQTYHITVTVSQMAADPFGFDFEALRVSDTNSIGTIVVTNSTETYLKNATVSGKVRINITHQLNGGATNDSHSFNFDWTAPAGDSGYIKFYAAGVAADGDDTPSGDYVYTTSQLIGGPSDVGVHNLAGSPSFSIYPNPVNSYCNIRFGSEVNDERYDVQLYDITGSLVQSCNSLKALSGEITNFKIADHIASGTYLMRITSNGNTFTQKIIVNKN